jgi:hypothetical protein
MSRTDVALRIGPLEDTGLIVRKRDDIGLCQKLHGLNPRTTIVFSPVTW